MRRQEAGSTGIHTLWGELAWQLGAREGYDLVHKADESWQAPSCDTLQVLLRRFSPSLILIDEWADCAGRLASHPGLPTGAYDAHLAFAEALSKAVSLTPKTLLVTSMSGNTDSSTNAADSTVVAALKRALETGIQTAITTTSVTRNPLIRVSR